MGKRGVLPDETKYPACSEAWRGVLQELPAWQEKGKAAYLSVSAAMKGGEARAAVDPKALLVELQSLDLAGWRSSQTGSGPKTVSPGISDVDEALRTAESRIDHITNEEWDYFKTWATNARNALGEDHGAADVPPTVVRLRKVLTQAGVPFTPARLDHAQRLLAVVDTSAVDGAIETIEGLAAGSQAPSIPAMVDASRSTAMQAWTDATHALEAASADASNALSRLRSKIGR